jgi:hypothetical protein
MKAINAFAILGIEPGATMQGIRQAWLDQLQAWHPDRFEKASSIYATAEEKTKLINAAYDMLKASGGVAPPPQPESAPEQEDEANWDDEPGPFRAAGSSLTSIVMEFGGEVLGFVFLLLKQVFNLLLFCLEQFIWPLAITGLCVVAYLRPNTLPAPAKALPARKVFLGTALTPRPAEQATLAVPHPTPFTPWPTPLTAWPTTLPAHPAALSPHPTARQRPPKHPSHTNN